MSSMMLYRLWKPGQAGQWIVAITACFASMTSGQGFAWPSPALPKIRSGTSGFNLTEDEEAWMVSATFIGNLVSPIPAGYIMDYIGRTNSLLIFDSMAVSSWLIIYFSYSALGLYIARFLVGAWAGFVYTVVPALIGEVVQPEIRGAMGAMFGVMLYLGALFESVAGIYLDYNNFTLLSALPAVLLFLVLLLLPESPYFYLMKGNRRNAAQSIEWLRGSCDSDDLDTMEAFVQEQLENKSTFLDIFKTKATKRAFVIVEVLGAVQRGAGLSLLFSYVSVTVPDSWVSAEQSFTVLVVVWIIGSFASSFFMDRLGRRTLLLWSCLGSCFTFFGVSVWFYLEEFTAVDTSTTQWLPLVLLVLNGVVYSVGLVSIPTLVQGELFPVNIKSKASALAAITMSLVSGLSVRAYQPLTKYVGVYSNFFVCAISCGVGAVFALTYMVETRGKSLEEIQETLSERKRKRKNKKRELRAPP